jgi:hypothetical protein
MFIKILKEAGYEESLLGLMLSFYDHEKPLLDWGVLQDSDITNTRKTTDRYNQAFNMPKEAEDKFFWTTPRFEKAQKLAYKFAHKIGVAGETRNNPDYIRAECKFLRQIQVWVYIQASRSFFSEFDTYMVGVTKQSSSTMHTLAKRTVTCEDFEQGTLPGAIDNLNKALEHYHDEQNSSYHDVTILKDNLPEGWLQERMVNLNYEVLRNITNQREGHRLKYWDMFNEAILTQVQHPELIRKVDINE